MTQSHPMHSGPPNPSSMQRFLRRALLHWPPLTVSLIASLLFVATSAALIWLVGPLAGALFGITPQTPIAGVEDGGSLGGIKNALLGVLDHLIVRQDRIETLARLCMAILLIAAIKNLCRYAQSLAVSTVEQRLVRGLREELFAHYQALSLSYYHRTRSGQIISRVANDVRVLSTMLDVAFGNLLRDPLLVLVLFGSLLVISWQLTLVALVVLPLSVTAIGLAGRFIRRYSWRSQEKMADLNTVLEENVTGVRVVKAFHREEYEIDRFRQSNRGFYRAMLKMLRVRHLNSPISEFLGTVGAIAILWLGGRAVLVGEGLSPNDFMTFIFLTFAIIQPIKTLAHVHARISEGRAAADRVFEALDLPIEVRDRPGARAMPGFCDAIRFENVGFHYDTGGWVLREINLQVPRGFAVALVGPSGGGKSTLCDLLARFYDPIEGRITIDGIDLRDLTIGSLRARLGIVTQDVVLFNDTVAHNIAYGDTSPDPNRLRQAAEAAFAAEFIDALPLGFETVIGPRGMKLSGGQRQRIAIARAIYKDPPILIFDEATSALDTASEFAVQRAINNLLRDRTALIVAHRLSTVRDADLIAIVDAGRIIDTGTHETLLERGGLYRRLHDMQFADTPQGADASHEAARTVL